ncbi:N-acetyltransferase [Pontibacillus marinus]|uniref:UDP-3-O-(3-hydroxymyristoyl) glucosamine N-acyltransferase n=1 Tax=Pontibacillus marinus BH030004 = DSM 16465 TaxID=1385511 RepID=A0A0A5I086_9BACI|nr:N-acetyltransferase [Pontibacillus marinus]KGX89267.1 UDP-3-O-(3-hydroxymyristoyl) glucosamine N-acyltransferase [Pontibacillus marinus BH030004 = DSM 16465]
MENHPNSLKKGEFVVIEDEVDIGENVSIGHNTVILKGTVIGDNVNIGCNCVIGIQQGGNTRMRKSDEMGNKLIIKDNTYIGNIVSIYSGSIISKNVFVGDHASIRENVLVDSESVIGRGAIIELNTKIGKACTVQTLAYVTGDTTLEDHVFIGPCVSMSNDKYMGAEKYELKGPTIKENAKIGNNSSLLPNVVIGKDVIVGAGSVVTKNIQDGEKIAGVPANSMKK